MLIKINPNEKTPKAIVRNKFLFSLSLGSLYAKYDGTAKANASAIKVSLFFVILSEKLAMVYVLINRCIFTIVL